MADPILTIRRPSRCRHEGRAAGMIPAVDSQREAAASRSARTIRTSSSFIDESSMGYCPDAVPARDQSAGPLLVRGGGDAGPE